jgi:hypothetical protein
MKPPAHINRSQGRHPRSEGRKQSSTSLTSIFSSFTNNSSGSSGSTLTITQESMSQPRTRSSKHTASSKSGSKRGNLSTSSSTQVAKVQDLDLAPSAVPNVFEFLDAEQSSTNLVQSLDIPSKTPTSPTHATDLAVSDNAQKEILNTSFHSDSGISMPDSISGHEELAEDGKSSNPQLKPKSQDHTVYVKRRVRPSANRVRPRYDESRERVDEDLEDLPYPEAYYLREGQAGQMIPPVAPQPPSNLKSEIEEASDISESESGYDFLAAKLSSSDIPPVYRRFAKLNHRLLLHLQDEITEMEQELEYLDDAETQCRAVEARATGRPIPPASRRIIPRSPRHNAVFFRRLDVLGRLSMKVEQYSTSTLFVHTYGIDSSKTIPSAPSKRSTSPSGDTRRRKTMSTRTGPGWTSTSPFPRLKQSSLITMMIWFRLEGPLSFSTQPLPLLIFSLRSLRPGLFSLSWPSVPFLSSSVALSFLASSVQL